MNLRRRWQRRTLLHLTRRPSIYAPKLHAWLARWMPPRSHLITIVRNPSQRAFSHVQMGLEWTENKCTEEHQIRTLRPLRPLLTFDKLMERSLIQMHWQECERLHPGQGIKKAPASFKWLMLPPEEVAKIRACRIGNKKDEEARLAAAGDPSAQLPPSGAPLWDCLRQMDADLMREYEPELLGDWPPLHEKSGLDQAVQLIGQCSEMMLAPSWRFDKGLVVCRGVGALGAALSKGSNEGVAY